MRSVRLSDVMTFKKGKKPKRLFDQAQNGALPYILIESFEDKPSGFTDDVSCPVVIPTDTILVCDGARTGLSSTGLHGYIGSTLATLKPDEAKIEPAYLFYFVGSKYALLNSRTRGAAIPHLDKDLLMGLELPLPSLTVQRRIVDILSRAEGIVRLRRDAEKKAAELIPALFLDMFGDPATNPMGWPTAPFGAIGTLDRGKSRHRPRDAAELYGGAYPFIQTGDVANSGGRITSYTTTYSELGLAQSRLWPRGTLCITIAANIAKTGVLDFDSCFPDSVVGFLPGERVRTEYVQSWLGFLQPTLEANAPQAAQKNINLEILRNLPVPVPPLDLQNVFDQRCAEVFSIQTQQSAATAKVQATFNALLAQVFHQ